MFDVFPKALSSVASFLFPLFASYKALKTGDPAQLTPWLMYWVVLACALLVESWTEFILVWVPFYAYIRLLFLLYLVLPQTQGARIIYQTHIHPWLEENESAIEDFIASAHDRLRAAGISYLKRAIDLLKTNVLGMPPDETNLRQSSAVAADATPQSYTTALLARFNLPSARWSGGAGASGADFYNLLASAVSAASSAAAGAASGSSSSSSRFPGGGSGGGSSGAALIPPTIRGSSAKMSFIAAQRERLNIVLSALDREADHIAVEKAQRRLKREATPRAGSMSLDGSGVPRGGVASRGGDPDDEDDHSPEEGSSEEEHEKRPPRPQPPVSGLSPLSKSRSEVDFEKIEAESGAEDGGSHIKRRSPAAASGLSSWMPWGWSGPGEHEVGEGDTTGATTGYEK